MEKTVHAPEGMVVTPHHLATQSAISVLRDGGTAVEAAVAAAATIAVVSPHTNGIGGDGFWLIIPPAGDPVAIEACGVAGSLATAELYAGSTSIPYQGPTAACTVAGTVGGWHEALNYITECGYQRKSLKRLLSDAIKYADSGFPLSTVTVNQIQSMIAKKVLPKDIARLFLKDGKVPKVGERFCQPELAVTLKYLAENGLNSFYNGELAKALAVDFGYLGIPITESDLNNFRPIRKKPIKLTHSKGDVFNLPPPTQGLVSLSILGILDKLNIDHKNDAKFIHATVEATKQAFKMRDQFITDPKFMKINPEVILRAENLVNMSTKITERASHDGKGKGPGDTVWIGVMDNKGFSVSFIQSLYHEFGSGVVLPSTGIIWHNRGVAFSLDKNSILGLEPGKKPFHTLNPAGARLVDGRVMVYGTRGGDGQPQTQAAIFHRYVIQGVPLQKSISMPRWCFGRTLGDHTDQLRIEGRFSEETVAALRKWGHKVQVVEEFSDIMGHAGALVRHADGILEGAFDPRSDGSVVGF
ncbi:hypothetical protein JYU34_006650 [Plutella xylostella]|uniref:Gamma-glutamyltransferase n=1 Tax=Plutella xylostella TaxID=51655 RepID=A0ABQ7QSG2_PLUXY|nr:hypothetical protein JYU34_006650 [Plutella xylostella]